MIRLMETQNHRRNSITCEVCDKVFPHRNAYWQHKLEERAIYRALVKEWAAVANEKENTDRVARTMDRVKRRVLGELASNVV